MSGIEHVRQFQSEVRQVVANGIRDQVPVRNMILELDEQKFQLQMILFQMERERDARELATKIMPANANGSLKIPDLSRQ